MTGKVRLVGEISENMGDMNGSRKVGLIVGSYSDVIDEWCED